jgi:hypothetical protein
VRDGVDTDDWRGWLIEFGKQLNAAVEAASGAGEVNDGRM